MDQRPEQCPRDKMVGGGYNVLKMLLSEGKITKDMIDLMDKWRHDELFDFYCKVLMQLTKDEYLQLPYVLNHCEANRHPFHIILED
jgi:hypothetical protein